MLVAVCLVRSLCPLLDLVKDFENWATHPWCCHFQLCLHCSHWLYKLVSLCLAVSLLPTFQMAFAFWHCPWLLFLESKWTVGILMPALGWISFLGFPWDTDLCSLALVFLVIQVFCWLLPFLIWFGFTSLNFEKIWTTLTCSSWSNSTFSFSPEAVPGHPAPWFALG